MSASKVQLSWENDLSVSCLCLLIVPRRAIDEPGYIRAVHSSGSSNKHELHALAQTAYYQFQDDELVLDKSAAPILVDIDGEKEYVEDSMILVRDESGSIRALSHGDGSARKLLETVNRYCTRWVRLDI